MLKSHCKHFTFTSISHASFTLSILWILTKWTKVAHLPLEASFKHFHLSLSCVLVYLAQPPLICASFGGNYIVWVCTCVCQWNIPFELRIIWRHSLFGIVGLMCCGSLFLWAIPSLPAHSSSLQVSCLVSYFALYNLYLLYLLVIFYINFVDSCLIHSFVSSPNC
jgi:hypothetical protein